MPRADYRTCRNCGRTAAEAGALSHTRLCSLCADVILRVNAMQIHEKSGPCHEARKYGIALREFGPRVALALKQAGVFDSPAVDTPAGSP